MAVLKLETDDILGMLVVAYVLGHIVYTLWLSFNHGYIAAWLQKIAKKYKEWRTPRWHGYLANSGLYHAVIYNERQSAAKRNIPWYDEEEEDANDLTTEHFNKRVSFVHGHYAEDPLPESAFPKETFVTTATDHIKNWMLGYMNDKKQTKRESVCTLRTDRTSHTDRTDRTDRSGNYQLNHDAEEWVSAALAVPRRAAPSSIPVDMTLRETQIQEMCKELKNPQPHEKINGDDTYTEAIQRFIKTHGM